jgi:hypothetical protein
MRRAIDVHEQLRRPPNDVAQSGVDTLGSRRGRLQLGDAGPSSLMRNSVADVDP